jgi:hypothetical protein
LPPDLKRTSLHFFRTNSSEIEEERGSVRQCLVCTVTNLQTPSKTDVAIESLTKKIEEL